MKTTQVKIAGREFSLCFTLDAMAELEERIEGFDLNRLTEYTHKSGTLADMITAMARQGELLEGRTLDVDRAWIGSHINPAPVRIATLQIAVLTAAANGMTMETEEEDGPRDVVLDEIKKKETPED